MSCTKIEPTLRATLDQDRSHISFFIYFFFSQTNIVFKFNLVSIGILGNFCHNLFTCLSFWLSFVISLFLKFIQCFYTFLNKTLLWLSVPLFFEGWKPQDVVTMFLFFMNISYLLAVKVTPDITNSLWFLHAV